MPTSARKARPFFAKGGVPPQEAGGLVFSGRRGRRPLRRHRLYRTESGHGLTYVGALPAAEVDLGASSCTAAVQVLKCLPLTREVAEQSEVGGREFKV